MSMSTKMKGWVSMGICLADRKGTVRNKHSWEVKKWLVGVEREPHTLTYRLHAKLCLL